MADGASLEIDGLQDWIAEMRALPAVLQQRLMKGAVATGASVVRKASIAKAPEWTGDVGKNHPPPGMLKKSIFQTRLVDECTPTVEAWKVDVRAGNRTLKSGTQSGAYYARMVEFGHFTRTPKGPGTRKARQAAARAAGVVRWIPAQPYMRPAFDANQQAAIDAMRDYIAQNLPAAVGAMRYLKYIGG